MCHWNAKYCSMAYLAPQALPQALGLGSSFAGSDAPQAEGAGSAAPQAEGLGSAAPQALPQADGVS